MKKPNRIAEDRSCNARRRKRKAASTEQLQGAAATKSHQAKREIAVFNDDCGWHCIYKQGKRFSLATTPFKGGRRTARAISPGDALWMIADKILSPRVRDVAHAIIPKCFRNNISVHVATDVLNDPASSASNVRALTRDGSSAWLHVPRFGFRRKEAR